MYQRICSFLLLALLASSSQAATYLYFNSEPGDYIGQGQENTWTELDGTFTANRNFDNGVSIYFNGSDWWDLDFAAPNQQEIVAGVYDGATRFPFQSPTTPGLDVSGSGRGCITLTGRFVVLDAVYATNGDVISFAADFEQHCEGGTPALFGSIRFNTEVGVPPHVDIKANLSDVPIELSLKEAVKLNLRINAGDGAGMPKEIWLGQQTPYGTKWFNGSRFIRSIRPSAWIDNYPLADHEQSLRVRLTKPGVYVFTIAIDDVLDGVYQPTAIDHVVVTVPAP